MGSFSPMHLIIVFFAMLALFLLVAGIVWLAGRGSRGGHLGGVAFGASQPPAVAADVESRLAVLSDLHGRGQITDEEYARQRAAIVASV